MTTSAQPLTTKSSAKDSATDLVYENPGYTSAELAQLSGTSRYELARRLPDARAAQQVKNGPARPCSISGRTAATWFPGPEPRAA